MARKYDFISELYNRTCKMVVANPESWEAFLRSACYNYRLRFDEQLLVHAQRPDATAVLQIDDWNQKFGRWVNRGAHGIAVFEDADKRRQRLVHYFDISDTHPSRFSRRVPIWQMRDEYTAEVIDTLESTFGELNDKETLAVAIESAARNAVEDNIPDYLSDLIYSVKDSFLDGVSEEEITHIFKKAVRNSVAYMTMTRLGIEVGEYFEPDDLRDVVNFTTPATLNALGYATSDIAEMGLSEISRTILALDRQKGKPDYTTKSNQFISLVRGEYGHTPVAIDPDFRKLITGNSEEVPYNVNSYVYPENPVLPECGGVKLAANDEEYLLLELLPNVAKPFLTKRRAEEYEAQKPAEPVAAAKAEEQEVAVEPITGPTLDAPMGGTVIEVYVKPGDVVNKGTSLLMYEAMKMQNEIESEFAGTVKRILVSPGQVIGTGEPLIEFE